MRGQIQHLWHERQKTIRTAIRLKYSLLADQEIDKTIDVERKRFFKLVQKGVLPAPVKITLPE